LRVVGIVYPFQWRDWGNKLLWMFFWTLLLPLPAMRVSEFLIHSVLPCHVQAIVKRDIWWYSRASYYVRQQGTSWQWGDNPRPAWKITVPLTSMTISNTWGAPGSPKDELIVDLNTGGFHYQNNGMTVSRSSGFGKGVLGDWMTANGLDLTKPENQQAVADVFTCIDETNAGHRTVTQFWPNGYSADVYAAGVIANQATLPTSEWYWPALMGFWVLAWLAGIWWIWRRQMKSKNVPSESEPTLPGSVG
jgi:hypothetical protein